LAVGSAYPLGRGTYDCDAADFDGDGDVDFAFLSPDGSNRVEIILLRNLVESGVRTFNPEVVGEAPLPGCIFLADFDDDGDVDLLLTARRQTFGELRENLGDGRFGEPRRFELGVHADHFATADLDGDSRTELLVGGWETGGAGRWRVFGHSDDDAPELRASYDLRSPPAFLHAADVDGDEDVDVVVGTLESVAVQVFDNTGDGRFVLPRHFEVSEPPQRIASADLDVDGRIDLVTIDGEHQQSMTVLVGATAPASVDCDASGVPDECEIAAAPALDCDDDGVLDLCWTEPDVDEDGVPDRCEAPVFVFTVAGPERLAAAPGERISVWYECVVVPSLVNDTGVQGWSIGVAADGPLEIVEVTTAGTVATGERHTRSGVAELASDGDRRGAACWVLWFGVSGSGANSPIPAREPALALRFRVEATAPAPEGEVAGAIELVDGLIGSGQPIANLVSWRGTTVTPTLGRLEVVVTSGPVSFQRGDANADGQLDISDGVAIFSALFLGGPPPSCLRAADVDDSGELQVTDVIALFRFLFLGQGTVAPGCIDDATPDALSCVAHEPCE